MILFFSFSFLRNSEILTSALYVPRPLHVAARNGLTVVVQELLAKGASVLAVDENGKHKKAYLLAIKSNRFLLFVLLLQVTHLPWPVPPTKMWQTASPSFWPP